MEQYLGLNHRIGQSPNSRKGGDWTREVVLRTGGGTTGSWMGAVLLVSIRKEKDHQTN
jgi:hypothetical protein